ncbi:MAG: tRNA-dihydrouridine synthase [Candidatus Wallbacteria bacterium]|nr:tRNA-dihydrouridine synthase [Candidatus Wallbacteria bacterium]
MPREIPFLKSETGFPLLLAPIAGFTGLPLRTLCREYGADFVFTELTSTNAIYYGNKRTLPIIASAPEEHSRLSIQIFGHDLKTFDYAADFLTNRGGFAGIDLNLGCCVKKVLRAKSGCYLMQEPDHVQKIFRLLRPKIKGLFSCKIRLGYDDHNQNYLQIAGLAEDEGLDFVTLHARTRSQAFGGEIDYAAIAKAARELRIPVIGNGNVRDQESLSRIVSTGASGAMIGRAAIGNPFVFQSLKAGLSGKTYAPDRAEVLAVLLRQGEAMISFHGEQAAVRLMRKGLIPYLRGFAAAARFRERLARLENAGEFHEMCDDLRREL